MKLIFSFFCISLFLSCVQSKREELSKNELNSADFSALRKDYVSGYNRAVTFDTVIICNQKERFHLKSSYYCLFDDGINLPGKYVWEDTTKSFTTHNFCHKVQIVLNEDTIFNKTISRNDFLYHLYPALQNYAVLMEPSFSFNQIDQVFEFSYSLSIPVTDVGLAIKLSTDKSGNIRVKQD